MSYNRGKNYLKHLKQDFNKIGTINRYEFDPNNPDDNILNEIKKRNSNK
jgi:hypothetical protein